MWVSGQHVDKDRRPLRQGSGLSEPQTDRVARLMSLISPATDAEVQAM